MLNSSVSNRNFQLGFPKNFPINTELKKAVREALFSSSCPEASGYFNLDPETSSG
jgi:hypothetical protein